MEHADPSCKHIIIHFTVIKFWPVAGSHLHEFSTSTCAARTGGNGFLRRFARYLNDAIDPLVEQTLQLTQEADILYNQVPGRTLVVIAAGHHVPKRDCFILRFLGLFLGAVPRTANGFCGRARQNTGMTGIFSKHRRTTTTTENKSGSFSSGLTSETVGSGHCSILDRARSVSTTPEQRHALSRNRARYAEKHGHGRDRAKYSFLFHPSPQIFGPKGSFERPTFLLQRLSSTNTAAPEQPLRELRSYSMWRAPTNVIA